METKKKIERSNSRQVGYVLDQLLRDEFVHSNQNGQRYMVKQLRSSKEYYVYNEGNKLFVYAGIF